MSPTAIIISAIAVYVLTGLGMYACMRAAGRERHKNLKWVQAQERAARDVLRPEGGVASSVRDAPFDAELEAEYRKAVDFVYALHLIDSAYVDDEWDRSLGEGRN